MCDYFGMKKTKNKSPSEHQEQSTFVNWMRIQHPSVRFAAIPNGTRTTVGAAVKAKKEGVSKGFPDLFIPSWALFIEFKRQKGGVISREQESWMIHLESLGYTCKVARGFEDAVSIVKEHLHLDESTSREKDRTPNHS